MYDRKEIKQAAKQQIKGNVATYFGLSIIISLILSASSCVVVGPIILSGPFEFGLALFIIETVRTKKGNFETGFNGFKRFGDSFVACFLTTLFTFLWSCLFVIPGIIASFRYSMCYYLLADNPEMSGYQSIVESKKMMHGHKWELFVLVLSFFWWYVLCAITLGFAFIYVAPYLEAAKFNFYEKLKADIQPTVTKVEDEPVKNLES